MELGLYHFNVLIHGRFFQKQKPRTHICLNPAAGASVMNAVRVRNLQQLQPEALRAVACKPATETKQLSSFPANLWGSFQLKSPAWGVKMEAVSHGYRRHFTCVARMKVSEYTKKKWEKSYRCITNKPQRTRKSVQNMNRVWLLHRLYTIYKWFTCQLCNPN